MNLKTRIGGVSVAAFVIGLLLAAVRCIAAPAPSPLPFTNTPAFTLSDVKNYALTSQFTFYPSTSNHYRLFRGVVVPTGTDMKLAIHSDDGARVSIDGEEKWNKYGTGTSLDNDNSFAELSGTFLVGREYCVEIEYTNMQYTAGDKDGVTLYAYGGTGTARTGLILTSTNDAVCLGSTMTMMVGCGSGSYGWTSSVPATASVTMSGAGTSIATINALAVGAVSIVATDSANASITQTVYVVKPGISPAFLTNCVGLTNIFVLTNSPGTSAVVWSQSGVLTGDGRTNTLAFTEPGTNILTASFGGCSVSATTIVVAVSSLFPVKSNLCASGTIVYTNQTTPAGFGSLVNWGGEGLSGTGASRTNSYSTVGPHIVSNWCGTSVKYSTATVYRIDIAQTDATVLADATAPVTFYLTNSYGAATWQISPSPGGGASFAGGVSGNTVTVNPGSVGTNYTITASADAMTSCSDTATLQVVKVAFTTNLVAFCEGTNASVAMTVTPSNFLSSLTFDTVTNVASGTSNTVASVTVVSTTNLILNPVSPGTATLRVRLGNSTFFGPVVKVVRVTFPTNDWYVPEGKSVSSNVTVIPSDAPVSYTTKEPGIATTTGSGASVTLTGVSNGVTKVIAIVGNSSCVQKDVTVIRLTLAPSEFDLCVGQSTNLTITSVPSVSGISVVSTETNVATVVLNGSTVTVTSVGPGDAAIVARVNGVDFGASGARCYRVVFATNDFYVAEGNVNRLPVEVFQRPPRSAMRFVAANTNIATVSGAPPLLTVSGVSNGMTQIEAWIGTNRLCESKPVNVVRPTVTSVQWRNLDSSPITTNNPNSGGGLLIFPDRPTPTSPAINQVRIRATISHAVPMTTGVFFQVYDVDDPSSTNVPPLDVEANLTDNRGMWTQLPLTGVNVDTNGTAETIFTVSTRAGDNFRAVASTSNGFFTGIQAVQDDGINARLTNTVLGGYLPSGQVTDLLTVWRRLHVEVDSMSAVVSNFVTGNITAIAGSSSAATNLTLDVNLRTGLNPVDTSPNLSTSNVLGRFESGSILIGASNVQSTVTGNGDNFLHGPGGFSIPAEIISGGSTINAGQVTALAGSVFSITANLGAASYGGGTLRVAGTSFSITANTASSVTVSGTPQIPFRLNDDDDDTLLPQTGNLSVLMSTLRDAYIEAIADGGGSLTNNQTNALFAANLPGTSSTADEASFQRQATGASDYWVAYLLVAYQYTPDGDNDPNFPGESGTGGVAWAVTSNTGVVLGGRGTQVFEETIRDRLLGGALAGLRERVTAHEIGHQMGLDHWDTGETGVPPGPVATNLMLRSMQNVPNNAARFVPDHLHLLRSRQNSPGL